MEKTLSVNRVFDGRLLKVDRLEVELDNGTRSAREIVSFPEVAVVMAFDEDGKVILVKQFRKPVEGDVIEAVAGKVDPGETPEAAARRELREETGYECRKLKKVGVVYPVPGYSTEKQHFFMASVTGKPAPQSGDDDEKIEVIRMAEDEVLKLVLGGSPLDGKLLSAIAFCSAVEEAGDDWEDDKTVFVSGHLGLTREEFDAHYRDRLLEYVNSGVKIVVGDAPGCDTLVQEFLANNLPQDCPAGLVTVYHMFEKPRNNVGNFRTVGGFKSDKERDAAMTAESDEDLAWVRPGRENSGTARNMARRRRR